MNTKKIKRSDDARIRRNRRSVAKRRGLEYVDLNKFDKSLGSHHINKKYVIYMPKNIHQAIKHDVKNGINIEEINRVAIKYLFDHPDTMYINAKFLTDLML